MMLKSKHFYPLLFGVVGVIIGVTIANFINVKISIKGYDLFLLGAFLIGLILITFITYIGIKSQRDKPHALGLPIGSIRAIIALSLVILFVFVSLIFYLSISQVDAKIAAEMANNILTTLGTLLIAVSAFYFGIKATEQGGKIAQDIFRRSNESGDIITNVPEQVIIEAIEKNEENWKIVYGALDIKLGKKKVDDTTYDLNCILFIVAFKINNPSSKVIPEFLSYINKEGRNWQIPTDVTDANFGSEFEQLDSSTQRKIIKDFISQNSDDLKANYPSIQSLAAQKKLKSGIEKEYYCLTIGVKNKLAEPVKAIPKFYDHVYDGKTYSIPTDVKNVGENQYSYLSLNKPPLTGEGIFPKKLGFSCSRSSHNPGIGSIGLKVKKNNKYFLLSCYHVLCEPELNSGFTEFVDNNYQMRSPGVGDGHQFNSWIIREGRITNKIDAALAEISDTDLVNEYPQFPGIKISKSIEIKEEHAKNSYYIRMVGRSSNLLDGNITDESATVFVPYSSGSIKLEDVILSTKISAPGDSGSAAFDQWFNVIGIIVSSNDQESAIIPIKTILDEFKIEIA